MTAARVLTTACTLRCPHGGTVSAVTSNSRVVAGGSALLTVSDTFVVSQCALTTPDGHSSPCVKVQWLPGDPRVLAGGSPVLDESSIGECLNAEGGPQGSAIIVAAQSRVGRS
jgi:hypothetical protein